MRNRIAATVLFVVIAFATSLSSPGIAQEGNQPDERPIYFPHTKSYFVLIRTPDSIGKKNWLHSMEYARKQVFHGVRGRLAIVRDRETHEFITKTFPLSAPTWIGLRFFCRFRKLMWVDGSIHPLSGFKVWHKQWYRNANISCSGTRKRTSFMPVYYTKYGKNWVWQASGPAKFFEYLIIEYPTGKK